MPTHAQKKKRRHSFEQKMIITLLVFILVLSVALVFLVIDNNSLRKKLNEAQNSSQTPTSSVASDVTSVLSESSSKVSVSSDDTSSVAAYKPDPDDWNLRLANLDNYLPDGFTVETGLITQAYASKNQMEFDARAVDELNAMLKAANDSGVNIFVVSSYRSVRYQTGLYNNEVQKWVNQGYDNEAAKKKAATIVAVPGTSDHNLGLAVDLNSVEESFENTRQFTWLQEHAEEYGFVMRFPKNKQDVTKIIYEPWHYRYVGVGAAKEMNRLGMCLEEYIVYLRGLGR